MHSEETTDTAEAVEINHAELFEGEGLFDSIGADHGDRIKARAAELLKKRTAKVTDSAVIEKIARQCCVDATIEVLQPSVQRIVHGSLFSLGSLKRQVSQAVVTVGVLGIAVYGASKLSNRLSRTTGKTDGASSPFEETTPGFTASQRPTKRSNVASL